MESIKSAYKSIGLEDKAPQSFKDITETDKLISYLRAGSSVESMIGLSDGYNQIGQYLDRPMLNAAYNKIKYENYFNDTAISEKIDKLVSELELNGNNIDKEFLINLTKSYGSDIEKQLDDSIEWAIMANNTAKGIYELVNPDYNYLNDGVYDDNFNECVKSFSDMLHNGINEIMGLIRNGDIKNVNQLLEKPLEGDAFNKINTILYGNEDVSFNVGGKMYKYSEIYAGYRDTKLFGHL